MLERLAPLVFVVAVACGRTAPPDAPPPPSPQVRSVTPAPSVETTTEELTFQVDGRDVPATVVAPAEPGRWPAVLLLAGSGPTDRDWNSPALPSRNGSARLLADELARRGVVVLRFDKALSGDNPGPPLDRMTLDTYRDEASAALTALRARPDVRADRVFVAGHSEGAIHATRLAQARAADLAGVLYLSPASRSMADTIVTQLERQLRHPMAGLSPQQADAELASLRAALDDFAAGKPVDPTRASSLPPVQQLVASLIAPPTAALARDLLFFDPAAGAATLALPMLVLGGGKDVQVDPELDLRHLERAIRATNEDVTFHLAPDADHVLKHEPKTMEELRANLLAVQTRYNADDRTLDPEVVRAIADWLTARTK